MSQHSWTKEEVARRGQEIYERDLRSQMEAGHDGQFLVVDITTGNYEIAVDDLTASDRMMARNPDAVLYGLRIGRRYAYHLGARFLNSAP